MHIIKSETKKPAAANINKRLIFWTAGLSVFALVAHAIDSPDHLKEWWGYSLFFLVVGAFQFFYGLALFLQPWRYDDDGEVRSNPERAGRTFYVLGLIMSLAMIAMYIVTRTSGLSFLAPDAVKESITPLSIFSVVPNLPITVILILLLIRTRNPKIV
jgi:hypothetical protein